MSKKIGEFNIILEAEALKRSIAFIAQNTVKEIKSAIKDVAFAAYSSIASDAQTKLGGTRQAYMSGLRFINLSPDNYLIYLDGAWPNKIEDGWAPYDMKEQLLKSTAKVKAGSRAGQDWVQRGKKGQRYAHVPFEHSMTASAAKGASDLSGIIKNIKAANIATGVRQKITKIYKDADGNPMSGKVATFKFSPEDIAKGLSIPNLQGLNKYQTVYNDKNGKERVKSVYMTFRTISDLSPAGKWYNKGNSGLKAFPEAERYVEAEIKNILDTLLK